MGDLGARAEDEGASAGWYRVLSSCTEELTNSRARSPDTVSIHLCVSRRTNWAAGLALGVAEGPSGRSLAVGGAPASAHLPGPDLQAVFPILSSCLPTQTGAVTAPSLPTCLDTPVALPRRGKSSVSGIWHPDSKAAPPRQLGWLFGRCASLSCCGTCFHFSRVHTWEGTPNRVTR